MDADPTTAMDPVRANARRVSEKTLCVDVDDTICFTENFDYAASAPNEPVVAKPAPAAGASSCTPPDPGRLSAESHSTGAHVTA